MVECEKCKAPIDVRDEEYGVISTDHGTYYVCEECRS